MKTRLSKRQLHKIAHERRMSVLKQLRFKTAHNLPLYHKRRFTRVRMQWAQWRKA